jgi:hypothetical protein
MLFIVYILLALLFCISTWTVLNAGLIYYLQMQNTLPIAIFIILLLLNLVGLGVGIFLSCWQAKKMQSNIKDTVTKTKNLLQPLSLLSTVVVPFSIGYALFKKSSAKSKLLQQHKSLPSWLPSIASEALMVVGGQWLSNFLRKKNKPSS